MRLSIQNGQSISILSVGVFGTLLSDNDMNKWCIRKRIDCPVRFERTIKFTTSLVSSAWRFMPYFYTYEPLQSIIRKLAIRKSLAWQWIFREYIKSHVRGIHTRGRNRVACVRTCMLACVWEKLEKKILLRQSHVLGAGNRFKSNA